MATAKRTAPETNAHPETSQLLTAPFDVTYTDTRGGVGLT